MQQTRVVTYYTIGLIEFYHCLFDEKQLENYGIKKEDFDKIRSKWEDLNPDNSKVFVMKRMISQRLLQLDFYQLLLFKSKTQLEHKDLLGTDFDFSAFDKYGVRYDKENPLKLLEERIQYEERAIKKQSGSLQKLIDQEQKKAPDAEVEFSFDDIMMVIASLETFTPVEDYFDLKLYRYEALTKMIKQRGEQQRGN